MMVRRYIKRVWTDDTAVYAESHDGAVASYPFAMWKKLAAADKEQREHFVLTYGGIHWPQLDEDLSFEGMFAFSGIGECTVSEESVVYEPSIK